MENKILFDVNIEGFKKRPYHFVSSPENLF